MLDKIYVNSDNIFSILRRQTNFTFGSIMKFSLFLKALDTFRIVVESDLFLIVE